MAFATKKDSDTLTELLKLKEEKLKILEAELSRKEGLPHKYGFSYFPWQRKFLEDKSRDVFLTKANQVGGSSIQIIKLITLATEPELWLQYFSRKPEVFLYFYPSVSLFKMEFNHKWIKEFLPKGKFKESEQYGWNVIGTELNPVGIRFKTGVEIHFRFYTQSVSVLQAFTLDYVAFDEEPPLDHGLLDECNQRRLSRNGIMSAVFTPTIAQSYFFDVMEGKGEKEKLPHASKYRISLYDCLTYEDGSPSHITNEIIKRRIATCKSEAEVQRRILGRFIKDSGLIFPYFNASVNIKKPVSIPKDWSYYAGIDLGSGGKNDPAAIVIIAVSPDFKKVIVCDGWIGVSQETTALDTANIYRDNFAKKYNITCAYYDTADKDFHTFTVGMGLPIQGANKVKDTGIRIMNILMKNNLIDFYECSATDYLARDFATMSYDIGASKSKAIGHIADALRYALSSLPLDFTHIGYNIVGGEGEAASSEQWNGNNGRDGMTKMITRKSDNELRAERLKLFNEQQTQLTGNEWIGYDDYEY